MVGKLSRDDRVALSQSWFGGGGDDGDGSSVGVSNT